MLRILLAPRRPIRSSGQAATGQSGFGTAAATLVAVLCLLGFSGPRPCRAEPATGTVPSVIVHGLPSAASEQVRLRAEAVRDRISRVVLGEAAPKPWRVPCQIHVHPSADVFQTVVGGPPGIAQGATSIEFAGPDIVHRRIDLVADPTGAVPDALAHEMVHVVLAERFPDMAPPRWADEGLAVLFDTHAKQLGHDADFRRARQAGMSWATSDLLALEDFPAEPGRMQVFYGQSAALVRWLVARRDAETFIKFLGECGNRGFDDAVLRHYDLQRADVELAWKEVPTIEALSLNR